MSTAAGATKDADEPSVLRKHAIDQIVELIKQEFTSQGKALPSQLAMETMAKKRLNTKFLT